MMTTWWPLGDHFHSALSPACSFALYSLLSWSQFTMSSSCTFHVAIYFALCRTDSWIVSDWIGAIHFKQYKYCMKVENRSIDESECRQCVHWEKFVKNIVVDSLSLRVASLGFSNGTDSIAVSVFAQHQKLRRGPCLQWDVVAKVCTITSLDFEIQTN